MAVIGHGIDIVELNRIEKLLRDPEGDFLQGAFTETEQKFDGAAHSQAKHFAGRIAAKEAIVKALGTGFSHGIAWSDIELGRNEAGMVDVLLSGRAHEIAVNLGVTRWHLSISHSQIHAVASAIAVND